MESAEITFDSFVKRTTSSRAIDTAAINLQPIRCPWMDASIDIRMGFRIPKQVTGEKDLTIQLASALGKSFPLMPALDREGLAFSSMQNALDAQLLRVRRRLVTDSALMLKNDAEGLWIGDLFLFFNTGVALVEHTLHQIYYKAKYDSAAMGWHFDEAVVGLPHGRRLKDKLQWVGQITGKHLDDAKCEVADFTRFKEVRNHLNHFDPPTFAATIEEIAEWLNMTRSIGMLLWKIRTKVGSPPSESLIKLLLAPTVDWVPHKTGLVRPPPTRTGYRSSVWPGLPPEPEDDPQT